MIWFYSFPLISDQTGAGSEQFLGIRSFGQQSDQIARLIRLFFWLPITTQIPLGTSGNRGNLADVCVLLIDRGSSEGLYPPMLCSSASSDRADQRRSEWLFLFFFFWPLCLVGEGGGRKKRSRERSGGADDLPDRGMDFGGHPPPPSRFTCLSSSTSDHPLFRDRL